MKVKTVGLTGGIGSGKTYIAGIFKMMGIPVYDSDANAKRLMIENRKLVTEIKGLLGDDAYFDEGTLNREHISNVVFADAQKLQQLNALVHPAVRLDFQDYIDQNKNCEYIINEAALFVENGGYKNFDKLISVVAPEKLRLARVMQRDHRKEEDIKARISNQSSDQDKIAVSDFVIYNDVTHNLFVQIPEIHKELITFVRKEEQ